MSNLGMGKLRVKKEYLMPLLILLSLILLLMVFYCSCFSVTQLSSPSADMLSTIPDIQKLVKEAFTNHTCKCL